MAMLNLKIAQANIILCSSIHWNQNFGRASIIAGITRAGGRSKAGGVATAFPTKSVLTAPLNAQQPH